MMQPETILNNIQDLANYHVQVTGRPWIYNVNPKPSQKIRWFRKEGGALIDAKTTGHIMRCTVKGPIVPYIKGYKEVKNPKTGETEQKPEFGAKRPGFIAPLQAKTPAYEYMKMATLKVKAAHVFNIIGVKDAILGSFTFTYKELPPNRSGEILYEVVLVMSDGSEVSFYNIATALLDSTDPKDLQAQGKLKEGLALKLLSENEGAKRYEFKDFGFKTDAKTNTAWVEIDFDHSKWPEDAKGYLNETTTPEHLKAMQNLDNWGVVVQEMKQVSEEFFQPVQGTNWTKKPACRVIDAPGKTCFFNAQINFIIREIGMSGKYLFAHPTIIADAFKMPGDETAGKDSASRWGMSSIPNEPSEDEETTGSPQQTLPPRGMRRSVENGSAPAASAGQAQDSDDDGKAT
jgi:hypothetical protein